MPYMSNRPLPVNPSWTVDVRCPHGVLIRGDLDLVRSYQELRDPCPQAQAHRDAQDEAREARRLRREQSELHQVWLAFKFRRQMRRFRLDSDPDPDDPTEVRPR